MRMMLKVTIPVEAGNTTIKDGSLPKTIQAVTQSLKPEAAYFLAEDGLRTAMFFFDMKDASQIPAIVEPLFMGMNAAVTLTPVMNQADLEKGLKQAAKAF